MHRTRAALLLAATGFLVCALGVATVVLLDRGSRPGRAAFRSKTGPAAQTDGARAPATELDEDEAQASKGRSGRSSSIAKSRSEVGSNAGAPPPLRITNSVSGRVVWPDGRPAGGCAIDFEIQKKRKDGDGWFFVQTTTGDGVSRPDGTFELRALGRDRIALTALTTSPPGFARRADVEPGASGIVLVLAPGRNLAGRAVDDRNAPLESFLVTARALEDPEDVVAARGEKGAFLLGGLHDGTWEIRAESSGHSRSSARRIALPGDQGPLDLVLPRCAKVSGIVRLPSGPPAANARVRSFRPCALGLDSRADDASAGTRADDEGRFLLEELDAGPQRIAASKAGYADNVPLPFELRPGDDVHDVVLELRRGGRLHGEVLDPAGYPIPGLTVTASCREGRVHRDVQADTDGSFAFDALPAGNYRVFAKPSAEEIEELSGAEGESRPAEVARHSEGTRRSCAAKLASDRSAMAEVFEGGTSHVTIGGPVVAAIRVHGRVSFGAGGGRPFAGALVRCARDGLDDAAPRCGIADAAGRYELFVDAGGRYAITVSDPAPTSPYGDGTRFVDRVDVPGDAELEHDLVLPSASVSGRVLLSDGTPGAGVRVSLDPEPRVAELSASLSLGSRETDGAGAFAFEGLKAGVYRITANSMRGRVAAGTAVVKDLVLEEERAVEHLELRLSAPARIEGTITGPDGKPYAGAVVFLRDPAGSRLEAGPPPPTSDAGGRFSIDGLPPGELWIGARTEGLVTVETRPIDLRAGETSRIALELRAGTRLRVLVQEEDGRPVGASLRVADERGQVVGSAIPLSDGDRGSSETPESGLRIGPIPPGRYTITATNHDGASASREVSVSGDEQVVTLKYGS